MELSAGPEAVTLAKCLRHACSKAIGRQQLFWRRHRHADTASSRS